MNHQSRNPDNSSADEQQVQHALQHHLDAKVDELDFNVTNKLAAARRRALDQQTDRTSIFKQWLRWPAVAGPITALTVAVIVGNQMYAPTSQTTVPETTQVATTTLMEDLPILSSTDDFEFYQSLEFLEWMESNAS